METFFWQIAGQIAVAIEGAAVLIVTIGAVEAFVRVIGILTRPGTSHGARKDIWRRFGMWLLLGPEFELAADIVRSVISPSWLTSPARNPCHGPLNPNVDGPGRPVRVRCHRYLINEG